MNNAMESRDSRSQVLQPLDSDEEIFASTTRVQPAPGSSRQTSRRKESIRHSHPKPPLTPNTGITPSLPQSIPNPLLPSAPASPPTPAPSPTPHQRPTAWVAQPEPLEDRLLQDAKLVFSRLSMLGKEAFLAAIVDNCDNHLLSYIHQLVSPRLKKDPFTTLPNELCFKVSRRMRD
jgi:F-box and WD-40 domain protein CDC4